MRGFRGTSLGWESLGRKGHKRRGERKVELPKPGGEERRKQGVEMDGTRD